MKKWAGGAVTADQREYDDEMGVAGGFVVAFLVGFAATAIVAAAVVWNAVALTAEAIHTLKGKRN